MNNNIIKLLSIQKYRPPGGQMPQKTRFLLKITENSLRYIFIKLITHILFIQFLHMIPFFDREELVE